MDEARDMCPSPGCKTNTTMCNTLLQDKIYFPTSHMFLNYWLCIGHFGLIQSQNLAFDQPDFAMSYKCEHKHFWVEIFNSSKSIAPG